MMKARINSGFSLIEMSVVLIIVSLLLSSVLVPMSNLNTQNRIKQTQAKLNAIKDALMGYMLVNQRFPCPASVNSNGDEDFVDKATGECSLYKGFVPWRTLGIDSAVNVDNLLIDAWLNPFLYAVKGNKSNNPDCTSSPIIYDRAYTKTLGINNQDINKESIKCVAGEFDICRDDNNDGTLCETDEKLATGIPVIILSLGENARSTTSTHIYEFENVGTSVAGASSQTYFIPSNAKFIVGKNNSNTGSSKRFDDLLVWISPYVLYNRMVSAGMYP